MKRKLTLSLITGLVLAGALGASPASAACTPTGFIRDGMNLTAKVIADGDISGQTIDATGCNIGVSITDREPVGPSRAAKSPAPTTLASSSRVKIP